MENWKFQKSVSNEILYALLFLCSRYSGRPKFRVRSAQRYFVWKFLLVPFEQSIIILTVFKGYCAYIIELFGQIECEKRGRVKQKTFRELSASRCARNRSWHERRSNASKNASAAHGTAGAVSNFCHVRF